MPTLEELKAENAKEQAAEQAAIEAAQKVEEAAEAEPEPEPEPEGEPEAEAELTTEAWMQPEEGEQEQEAKFTDSDAAAIRRKYKAKAAEKDSEIETLRKEIDALKQAKTPAQQQSLPGKPDRESFATVEEYVDALTDYKLMMSQQQANSQQTAEAKKQAAQARWDAVNREVDAHYTRVHELATKSNIAPETYKAAETRVRMAVASVFPDSADAVVDELIASLGVGSEKVLYKIGISPSLQEKLVEKFKADPNGLKATVYLTELKSSMNAAVKRETTAPEPIERIQGDKANGQTSEKLMRQYKEAHKKHDGQLAFNIKRDAKKAGIDVSRW